VKLNEWQSKLKEPFTVIINSEGIGTGIEIIDEDTKAVIDLTDYESW
jgi:hypothetical protein